MTIVLDDDEAAEKVANGGLSATNSAELKPQSTTVSVEQMDAASAGDIGIVGCGGRAGAV